jgi:hypothetical protein
MQVSDSVDLGGHNKNRRPAIHAPSISLSSDHVLPAKDL